MGHSVSATGKECVLSGCHVLLSTYVTISSQLVSFLLGLLWSLLCWNVSCASFKVGILGTQIFAFGLAKSSAVSAIMITQRVRNPFRLKG